MELLCSMNDDWRGEVGVGREGEGEGLKEEENRVVVLKSEGICLVSTSFRR